MHASHVPMHATHVLIRGHVFTYAEKAPFVASGQSVLGALEYDCDADRTKCHECGEWPKSLSNHVRKVHGIDSAEYKKEHGLRVTSALSGMRVRTSASQRAFATDAGKVSKDISQRRAAGQRGIRRKDGSRAEWNNEKAKCQAQIIFRLMTLAVQVGHTPTRQQMQEAGLTHAALESKFGTVPNALRAAGLETNRGPFASQIPREFPRTEEEIRAKAEKWNAPMPWPKDYAKPSMRFNSSLSD